MFASITANESFGDINIHLIKVDDNTNDLWFTAEEIGSALEMSDPRDGVKQIFHRHKDELEEHSQMCELMTPGGQQNVRIFSEEGAYMTSMFSNSEKAKEFRRWLVGLLKRYRQGTLAPTGGLLDNATIPSKAYLKTQDADLKFQLGQLKFQFEQRKFHEFCTKQTDKCLEGKARFEDFDHAPLVQKTMRAIAVSDPRSKQLELF